MTKTEGAKARLKNRCERLLRLLEVDAPTLVIAMEAISVFKAGVLLDRHAVAVEFFAKWVGGYVSNEAGYCNEEACEEPINPQLGSQQMCGVHIAEQETFNRAMDDDEQETN